MSTETKQTAEVEKGTPGDDAAQAWSVRRDELARVYGEHQITWTEHPYVVRVEGYRGGRPIILGSNNSVQAIIVYYLEHQMPMAELLEGFPHLCEAQIYDALSYYYDHREEIDRDIAINNDVEYWMSKYPPGKYEIQK
jgi:uncharacterized protein (DUF433 family)